MRSDTHQLTAEIVLAYLETNSVAAEELPRLVQTTLSALTSASSPASVDKPIPAAPIKRSVFPDYLVCLEDGQKVKALTRYIGVRFGLTPDAYRTKWGLPPDYPMSAPNATRRRSEAMKLGVKSKGRL